MSVTVPSGITTADTTTSPWTFARIASAVYFGSGLKTGTGEETPLPTLKTPPPVPPPLPGPRPEPVPGPTPLPVPLPRELLDASPAEMAPTDVVDAAAIVCTGSVSNGSVGTSGTFSGSGTGVDPAALPRAR